MKRGFGWILPWLGVVIVCLLLSLGFEASAHQEPHVAWNRSEQPSRELVFLSSSRLLPSMSTKFIRSRAGPGETFLTPGLFFSVDDVGSVGPPWLDYRGPPGRCCGPRANYKVAGHTGSPKQAGRARFLPEIPAPVIAQIKNTGFCNSL
jgi:hypothetical protein